MTQVLTIKNLNELSESELIRLRELTVSDHQEILGKSFGESIEDWESAFADEVLGLCFFYDKQPVGLTLFRKQSSRVASIHGLKIATHYQCRGFGHQAFGLAVDVLRVAWPKITVLQLAVDAVNKPAIKIYTAAGMNDSGPIFQGPNGLEHRMKMKL